MADAGDLFRTPDSYANAVASWCFRNLPTDLEDFHVWEPCAGDGALCEALISIGVDPQRITASEIREDERAARLNSLELGRVLFEDCKQHEDQGYDLILTNPPFREGLDIAEACLERLAKTGTLIMLQRLQWLAGQKRASFFKKYPCSVLVLPWRESFIPDGRTDCWDYGWFVWSSYEGDLSKPTIEWLRRGD